MTRLRSRHAVLIANNGDDLAHAVRDAQLVGQALLRCNFCRREDLRMVLDQTGGCCCKDRFDDVGAWGSKVPASRGWSSRLLSMFVQLQIT